MFRFGRYALHAQCLTRILMHGDILTTTFDYQNWDEINDRNNDEWHFVHRHKPDIIGSTVVSVDVSPCKDLTISLDNGTTIQLFISNGCNHYTEETEQWVFFQQDDHSSPYITVYNKTVDITTEW